MGITYDDWRTTPPDLHAPDPPPDMEAVDEIQYAIRAMLHQASEKETHELGWSKLVTIAALAAELKENHLIFEQASAGHYNDAADDLLWIQAKYFGKSITGYPAHTEKPLMDCIAWLKRRNPQ